MRECLTDVQHTLFDLGGELCIPGHKAVSQKQVAQLEQTLDDLNQHLKPLKEFILPGGSPAAAMCHVARTVCRRAERRVVSLSKNEVLSKVAVQYLNRLSDLLFVMARALNIEAGHTDVLWQPSRGRTDKTGG